MTIGGQRAAAAAEAPAGDSGDVENAHTHAHAHQNANAAPLHIQQQHIQQQHIHQHNRRSVARAPQGSSRDADADASVRSGVSMASSKLSGAATAASGPPVHVDVAEDEPPPEVLAALEDAYEHPRRPARAAARARACLSKLRGGLDHRPKVPHAVDLLAGFIGAFAGIAVVSLLDRLLVEGVHFPLLVASFGASAVLLYGVPESKLSQPYNVIVGQVLSAAVGVAVRLAVAGRAPWLANALGMSLAMVAQQLVTATHPPGGATALIACSAPITAAWLGFQFVATVALGSVILVGVALVTNNLCPDRSYPTYWF